MIDKKVAAKYFSKKKFGDEIKFLPKKQLLKNIEQYGNYGIGDPTRYLLKDKKYKIDRIRVDFLAFSIIDEMYSWPWWFFEIPEEGQLEFDF